MRIPANSAAPETERKEFELIPEGKYLCKVLDVQVKRSTESGNEYWALKLEIQDGKYEGKFIFDNLFFTEKALNRFFLVWKRLTGFELDRTKDLDVDESDLLGCKALVTVIHREELYKGEKQKQARVPYDGYADVSAPKTEKKASKNKESADEDDDIPF